MEGCLLGASHFLAIDPLMWLTGIADWIQKQNRITRSYTNLWKQFFVLFFLSVEASYLVI